MTQDSVVLPSSEENNETIDDQYVQRTQDLVKKVLAYDKSEHCHYLVKAIELARESHKDQRRASGEPYFSHPLAVAEILAEMKLDALSVITGLLHDTVEDTTTTLKKIEEEFTSEVAELVNGVTKINFLENKSESVVQAENLRKFIVSISKDIRILLVKLADRLHNMQTLNYIKSEEKRIRIATETIEIFVPLAERIGIHTIKNELEDLSFKVLHPDIRDSIISRIQLLKSYDNNKLPQKIISTLHQLFKTHHIEAKIVGREKTPYSIWAKMKRKQINFEQLSDIMAFRIIVKDILECYKTLGVIHNHYHTIPQSFKDYISMPKQNGYQSLHTIIMGPEQQKIEIQIRTEKIHKTAEWGITAHWSYKQKNVLDQKYYNWINELLSILESSADPNEILNNAKLEIYYDQVFCFTPRGRVIALPNNSCAVDFAYAIHSDVGNKCVGAKINGKLMPLKTRLQNGDQVEIITDKNHTPLASWEKFVTTAKALSCIKKTIRQRKRDDYISLGKVMISHALNQLKISFNNDLLKEAVSFFNKENVEELLRSIGEGHIPTSNVVRVITGDQKKPTEQMNPVQKLLLSNKTQISPAVKIHGNINDIIAIQFASCCHPIPGDKIVGIDQSGKGVVVHVSDCETLQNYSSVPEKWLEISWTKNIKATSILTTLQIVLLNKPGSLATIALEIAKQDSNISNIKILSRAPDFFEIVVDLDTKGAKHLSDIILALQNQTCVHSVQRYFKH